MSQFIIQLSLIVTNLCRRSDSTVRDVTNLRGTVQFQSLIPLLEVSLRGGGEVIG